MLFYLAIAYLILAAVTALASIAITWPQIPFSPCRTSRAFSWAVVMMSAVVILWSAFGLWLAVSSPTLTG